MIKVFKLSNGEVIISNVQKENADSYSLSYPASLINNSLQMFLPETGGKCNLLKCSIIAVGDADSRLEQVYNNMFGPSGSSDLTCTK